MQDATQETTTVRQLLAPALVAILLGVALGLAVTGCDTLERLDPFRPQLDCRRVAPDTVSAGTSVVTAHTSDSTCVVRR